MFYLVSGTTYKCRSSATLGSVTSGSKQTFSGLSLTVQTGDLIGIYYDTGEVSTAAGDTGFLHTAINTELIDPNDQGIYSVSTGRTLKLYGTGS